MILISFHPLLLLWMKKFLEHIKSCYSGNQLTLVYHNCQTQMVMVGYLSIKIKCLNLSWRLWYQLQNPLVIWAYAVVLPNVSQTDANVGKMDWIAPRCVDWKTLRMMRKTWKCFVKVELEITKNFVVLLLLLLLL